MKIPLIIAVILLYSVSFTYAQSAGDSEGEPKLAPGPQAEVPLCITGISVSGLKRTSYSTAERPLRKFIGLEAEQLDINEVWAAVMNTGILEPIAIEIHSGNAGEKILSVSVHEKWSIFPIPVVMIGTSGISAGGAIFDANAFGLNDKLFIAGIYYSDGWVLSGGYTHAPSGAKIPGWNTGGSFSREERIDRNQCDEELRRFEQDEISAWAGLIFHPLENSDLLSITPGFSYSEKILRNTEDAKDGPDEGLRMFGAGMGVSLGKSSWDGYLLSREEASLNYSFKVDMDATAFQSIRFRGVWEKSIIPGFRFNFKTGLLFDPNAPILFESSPSAAQVSILPRSFSARRYAGVSAGLEKYLFKIAWGTFSVSAAYQFVYSHGSILGDSIDHGVAGMFSFYLSRLAIPALGLGASYNVKEKFFQFNFSIGMSF